METCPAAGRPSAVEEAAQLARVEALQRHGAEFFNRSDADLQMLGDLARDGDFTWDGDLLTGTMGHMGLGQEVWTYRCHGNREECGILFRAARFEKRDAGQFWLSETPETPGSVVDRLAILALRIYHLDEQIHRENVDISHQQSVSAKRAVCIEQRTDLANSLRQLLGDISAGRKRHKIYRQFKMYNDPTLNPYLYQSQKAA